MAGITVSAKYLFLKYIAHQMSSFLIVVTSDLLVMVNWFSP